jgi:hypothetical protein
MFVLVIHIFFFKQILKDLLINLLNITKKAATSSHGLDLNYRVIYVEDACRGVDLKDIEEQKKRLSSRGALMVNSKQVFLFKTNFLFIQNI